jgi:hypothetical protein
MGLKMATPKSEGLQWVMTVLNTMHSIFDTVGGIHEKMPETFKQKLPGFLGLSLADEQIFNGLLGQLSSEEQLYINGFLDQCKDFQRNRFINVVAGMEVAPGKPEEKETKLDKSGKKIFEKTKTGSEGKDQRMIFLKSFAKLIKEEFGGNFYSAYYFCISSRLIKKDSPTEVVMDFINELVKKYGNKTKEKATELYQKTTQTVKKVNEFDKKPSKTLIITVIVLAVFMTALAITLSM